MKILSSTGHRSALSALLIAATLAYCGQANATTLTWFLSANFDSGTTAQGMFDFDADTTTFSNISIGLSTGETLTSTIAVSGGNAGYAFFAETATPSGDLAGSFQLEFDMTNAGGTIDILQSIFAGGTGDSYLGICVATCANRGGPFQELLSGMISTTPPSAVPLPAAAWLFISGLAGLFGFKRYKTA